MNPETKLKSVGSSLFRQQRTGADGQVVQFNKGHYCLDTDERLQAFSDKLASGWEDEYREYRRLWTELPINKTIRQYPLLLDIELASACNLKCPMCYTITEEFKKKVTKGLIDWDLFKKIIDEVQGKVFAVRLSLRGESTLHRHFIDCIRYCKDAGIKEISTLTNGSKLHGDYLKQVIEAGIDWITISIDGTGETYEKIRKPITFAQICENLRQIREFKDRNNLIKPVIKVQGIWPAIRENPELYYNTFVDLADLVAFNPLIDYLRNDTEIVYEDSFSCPQLYQRLVIGSDGRVMMCSNDEDSAATIGDVNTQTIHEIWHGEKLDQVRRTHSEPDGFQQIDVCRKCYYPRKVQVDETAQVGEREILIENYINRPQQVGS